MKPDSEQFFHRLRNLGTSLEQVLRLLEVPADCTVIGYTSQIDGFGTNQSDLDIYIFSDKVSSPRVENVAIGTVIADVEFCPVSYFQSYLKSVKNINWDDPEIDSRLPRPDVIKQLYRVAVGACLQEGTALSREDRQIPLDQIQAVHIRHCRLAADDGLEDAVRLFGDGHFIPSIHMARKAFDMAAMGYLATQGVLIFKPKWIYPAICKHLGMAHPLHEAFLEYHFRIDHERSQHEAQRIIRHIERILMDLT